MYNVNFKNLQNIAPLTTSDMTKIIGGCGRTKRRCNGGNTNTGCNRGNNTSNNNCNNGNNNNSSQIVNG